LNIPKVNTFLETRLNLQLATIDEIGDPNIQPVWFDGPVKLSKDIAKS